MTSKDVVVKHCSHNYVFIDGFETCINCGLCGGLQDYRHNIERSPLHENISEFSYILSNHGIGFDEEIEQYYHELKKEMNNSFEKIVLYAFSAYTILFKNNVYYTIAQIERIFNLHDFKKKYSKIKNKQNACDFEESVVKIDLLKSSISIFLAENDMNKHFSSITKSLDKEFSKNNMLFKLKPNVLMAVFCLNYFKNIGESCKLDNVCDYYNVNKRTAKRLLKKLY